MTYDSDTGQDIPHTPDLHEPYSPSHLYSVLPAPGSKYAPPTFYGHPYELDHFLEVYEQTCLRHRITTSQDKYKGLILYCSPKIAKTIRSLPSHKDRDFEQLQGELQYFYGDEQGTYNIGKVEKFTSTWRQRKMISIDMFKRYHRKYLELVGEAREQKRISTWDYNRYFWEGLNESLRHRIEHRMSAMNPDLDVSIPFSISKVVKGAEYILSPHRFDQHLQDRGGYHSSDTEPESDPPVKQRKSRMDPDSEDESDKNNKDLKPLLKRKTPPFPIKTPLPKKQERKIKDDDEFDKMVEEMSKLSVADPRYRAKYIQFSRRYPDYKGEFEKPARQFNARTHEPPPPFQRETPPHQPPNAPPGRNPNFDGPGMYCFGCGHQGHHIRQCEEINALIRKGQIIRDPNGRLQWPDGSRIYRQFNETWTQAIKNTKQANLVKVNCDYEDSGSIYNYVGVSRESDDASTDDQEELGWSSGQVSDRQAYGAERADRVSKDTRRKVQFDPPGIPQGMKKFPRRGEAHGTSRPQGPIHQNVRLDSNQARGAKRFAPIDVNQDKFEGKVDNQLLPMMVDQEVPSKLGNDTRKNTMHQDRSFVPKVTNPGTDKDKNSTHISQQILNTPLTLTVREAVEISPTLRRELSSAVKQVREVSTPIQEKKGLMGDVVDEDDEPETLCAPAIMDENTAEARDDLLTIPAKVGRARMTGIFDCGSQVSIISKKLVEKTGLPWTKDKRSCLRLMSVDGTISRCVGKVPNAQILVTGSELPTYGDLYIKENPGFQLLLGRTWGTKNRANLKERTDGSYLSFESEGTRYKLNACPSQTEPKDNEESIQDMSGNYQRRSYVVTIDEDEDGEISAQNDEQNEGPTIPPSKQAEISTQALDDHDWDFKNSPIVINEDFPTPAQRQREDDEEQEATAANASPPDEEARADEDPVRSDHALPRENFSIDSELQEDFIKMLQDGKSNDEWNAFCGEEKRKLRRNSSQWRSWNQQDIYEEFERPISPETDEARVPFQHQPKAPEPSLTLATHDSESEDNSDRDRRRDLKPDHRSVITAARRSKRVRRETERAKGDEYKKLMRTYQRTERQSRKTVRSRGAPITNSDMYAWAVRIADEDSDSSNDSDSPGKDSDIPGPLREECDDDDDDKSVATPPTETSDLDEEDSESENSGEWETAAEGNEVSDQRQTGEALREAHNPLTEHSPSVSPLQTGQIEEGAKCDCTRVDEVNEPANPEVKQEDGIRIDPEATDLPPRPGERGPDPKSDHRHDEQHRTEDYTKQAISDIPKYRHRSQRIMRFERGPFNVHERPGGTEDDPASEPEAYSDPGHESEPGNEDDQRPNITPLGIRYIPRPRYVPSGVLAALDIFPFAKNEELGEHYFRAYGVTLATEDRHGKVVYFHGDADIRVMEPDPDTLIEVPRRDKTRDARERLFKMNRYALKNRYVPNADKDPTSDTPGGNTVTWHHMAPDELEAVLDELSVDPMMQEEDTRTYTIQRMTDGTVEVQRGLIREPGNKSTGPPDHDASELEEANEYEKGNKKGLDVHEQTLLTRFGSDPQASDQALDDRGLGERNSEVRTEADPEPNRQKVEQCMDLLDRQEISQEIAAATIKAKEETHLEASVTCNQETQESANTDPINNGQCSCGCSECPEITSQPLQSQPSPANPCPKDNPDDPRPQDNVPPVDDMFFVEIPPTLEQRPGLLAAAHLVELKEERLSQANRSFFAYGATIVGGKEDQSPSVHQGHAYVRLYGSSFDEHSNVPRPPPEEDARMAQATLFSGRNVSNIPKEEDLGESSLLQFPDQSISQVARGMDPNAPPFVPTKVSITDERGEEMDILDAIKGLRAFDCDVRLPAVSDTEEESAKVKDGGEQPSAPLSSKIVSDNRDPVSDRDPPLHIPYATTTYRIPAMAVSQENDNPAMAIRPFRIPPMQLPSQLPAETKNANQPTTNIDRPAATQEPATGTDHGSPPPLLYPDEIEEGEVTISDQPKFTFKAVYPPPKDVVADDQKEEGKKEAFATTTATGPDPGNGELSGTLERIQANLDVLLPKVECLDVDDRMEIMDGLASLGLLQVTFDLGHEKQAGRELDNEYWKKRIYEALMEKSKQMEPTFVGGVKIVGPDENLKTHEEPKEDPAPIPVHISYSPVDWNPGATVPAYVPRSPEPKKEEEEEPLWVPRLPKPGEIEDVQWRVTRLEQEIASSTDDLHDRVRKLENQTFIDGCLLTELKWQVAELRKVERTETTNARKEKTDMWNGKKKNYRKNPPSPPVHRYPTRYAQANTEGKLADIRKTIEDLTEKIKTLEERVKEANHEIDQLKDKIGKALELGPRIDELAEKVEAQRKLQVDTNSVLLSEFATFKHTDRPNLESQIKQQAFEIGSLNQRYQQLYNFAMNLLYPSQTASSNARIPYTPYPTPINTPERRSITAF